MRYDAYSRDPHNPNAVQRVCHMLSALHRDDGLLSWAE
jgi:hypothetical protein